MKLTLAFAVWTVMTVVLGVGLVLAAKGSLLLLGLSLLVFMALFTYYGCLPH